VKKSGLEKYCANFTKKVVQVLERNQLNVCDPGEYSYVSRYRKMNYKLPDDLTKMASKDDDKHMEEKDKSKWIN